MQLGPGLHVHLYLSRGHTEHGTVITTTWSKHESMGSTEAAQVHGMTDSVPHTLSEHVCPLVVSCDLTQKGVFNLIITWVLVSLSRQKQACRRVRHLLRLSARPYRPLQHLSYPVGIVLVIISNRPFLPVTTVHQGSENSSSHS